MKRSFLTRAALACAALALAARASALDLFPSYFTLPKEVRHLNDGNLEIVDLGEHDFELGKDQPTKVRGKKWSNFVVAPESVAGDWSDPRKVYDWMAKSLAAGGWKEVFSNGHGFGTFRLQKGGIDAWAELSIGDETTTRVIVVEPAAQTTRLALPPPAASPETVREDADFPYLLHYPGSTLNHEERYPWPLDVTADGDLEDARVGTGYVEKDYRTPERLSALQFVAVYEAALTSAGWTVRRRGVDSLAAHYAKSGRDVWATLTFTGDDLRYAVADLGRQLAPDALKAALDAKCKVALYGVHFDFAKATLRPDSTSVLERVRALLERYPDLTLEIAGHTDGVGNDKDNQRLSEARAASVVAWLSAHGVAGARLTSMGYGKSRPVADNETPDGRAKNRRVELARPGCDKK